MSDGEALVKPNPTEAKELKGGGQRGGRAERRQAQRTVFFKRGESSHLPRKLSDLLGIPKTTEAGEEHFPGQQDELRIGLTVG